MASVTFKAVEKRFGAVAAVRDLNLEVPDGAFAVLVGPSGCGKTTTLRMVAGLEDPTGGDLLIGERRVNDVSSKDRDIAMVFQSYALYPHMTVFDNIAFGLKMRGVARAEIERRVVDVSAMLGLGDLLKRRPRELSGGQRQRVAMGRAVARKPQVFLFDEPLSNLDAQLRSDVRTEIARLHRQLKTTTIYVTHDQVEAMTLAQVLIVMKDGLVQQVGAPLEVYERPANRFVAGFLGTPPMNFLSTLEEGCVVGIRPQALRVETGGPLKGTIEVLETLGSETLAHVRLTATATGERIVARLEPKTSLREGSSVELAVDASAIRRFSRESGVAVRA
ncbi:MAG: ABC transporter ATP-binding protein [Deltaproteobacteria bacterium]|nr:ABC transporter ATP-binding protein [Deltaproteobacteria bacterium]